MVKVDLQDAFYHIPNAPADKKYFTFRFCRQLYQFNVLPMGWLNSPYYFSKVMRNVVRFWRDPTTALCRRQHQQPPLPPHVLFPSLGEPWAGGQVSGCCPIWMLFVYFLL